MAEVELAGRLGLDVIVTDHHRPGERLPDCPIVHPTLCGYPFADLCATGVVFKLAQALYATAERDPAELEPQLDLVALATVADIVSLTGENRSLVRAGLRVLAGGNRPGLRALLRVVGVDPQSVSEHTLGFVIGPRINAAGRLYRPDAGLELMLTADEQRALAIARELDAINQERRSVETEISFEAERAIVESGQRDAAAIVLAGEGWHPGVIGIVASRVVERYRRPCVMIALDESGVGKGSGRSIGAYDLHAGLGACSGYLSRWGGHRMAAGIEIEGDSIDAFRDALAAHADSMLEPEDFVRSERVDAIVSGRPTDARSRRAAGVPASVRDRQPGRQPAGARRARLGRALDGRGPPLALHRDLGRGANAGGRVRLGAVEHRRRRRRRPLRRDRAARAKRVAGSDRAEVGVASAAPGRALASAQRRGRARAAPVGGARSCPSSTRRSIGSSRSPCREAVRAASSTAAARGCSP